jgi:voltage-gated potassium channel
MTREPVVLALGTGRVRWVYEGVMVVLALLVIALLPFTNEGWVRGANLAIWAVFVVDYFTRLGLSTDRRRFLHANIIDLLAIMPADFFRALRVLRVTRLLRVLRAAAVLARVGRDVRGVTATNGLGWVLAVALTTVLSGSVVVWLVEPTIGSLPDALWWSTVTATTVGYGDLSPDSMNGRAVAVVLMLIGIGTIGMLTGSIATYFLGGGPKVSDPDVEHIRQRLADWADLSGEERQRLAVMLAAMARDAQPAEFDRHPAGHPRLPTAVGRTISAMSSGLRSAEC